ncbi:putative holin-like toxin [Lactococcus fujiensis]|nr:putative holin-like toxin [Lactococcus fujiensis]
MSVSDALNLMIAFGSFLLMLVGLVIEIIKSIKK